MMNIPPEYNKKLPTQFKIRIPLELKWQLEVAALRNNRSVNMEAVYRLMQSFTGKPRFRVPMGRRELLYGPSMPGYTLTKEII